MIESEKTKGDNKKMDPQTPRSTAQQKTTRLATWPSALAAAAISLGACGPDSSVADPSDTSTPAEEAIVTSTFAAEPAAEPEDPVELVASVIEGGVLTVDFSGIDDSRSMMSRVFDADGEPIGIFVHTDADGSNGSFVLFEPGEDTWVPDGGLSGASDSFNLDGLDSGSYRSCVTLVQTDRTVCTDFAL